MKYWKIIVTALVILNFANFAQAAEKYRGKWGSKTPTSITIKSTTPLVVRYCYKSQCTNHEPTGNLNNMTFKFPKRNGFPGAKMTMKKSGNNYMGRYKRNGSTEVYTATLKKSAF